MKNVAMSDEPLSRQQLEDLGEEIATFAARVTVAMHALLTRLRTFDAHEGWGPTGFLSTAHWLSWRIGLGLKAASGSGSRGRSVICPRSTRCSVGAS